MNFDQILDPDCQDSYVLLRKKHVEKLKQGFRKPLTSDFPAASQTWLTYWICHPLALMEQDDYLSAESLNIIKFLNDCKHPDGGYGGGPGQIAHLATTYAAINSLITLSSEIALESIDRTGLIKYMHRMKQGDGSFRMHDGGEIDSRAVYCALSILKCLNIDDPLLLTNVDRWILSCQTYEGGFGSIAGAEAHGGYTFCCVASLCMLDLLSSANIPNLLRWLTNRQIPFCGGFSGRPNKHVDSCYSFWQGAIFSILQPWLLKEKSCNSNLSVANETWLFDSKALQEYVLKHCQSLDGLLRDKPGKNVDFYHTSYSLSGLSITQHQPNGMIFNINEFDSNTLAQIHPLFNLTVKSLEFCRQFFMKKTIKVEQVL